MSDRRRNRNNKDHHERRDGGNNRQQQQKQRHQTPSPPRRNRPAPPPPPPKALVTLLKKNKSVLTYFTSLQENLEADVRKWKDRARNYQALYEEQLEENKHLKDAAALLTTKTNNKKRKRHHERRKQHQEEEEKSSSSSSLSEDEASNETDTRNRKDAIEGKKKQKIKAKSTATTNNSNNKRKTPPQAAAREDGKTQRKDNDDHVGPPISTINLPIQAQQQAITNSKKSTSHHNHHKLSEHNKQIDDSMFDDDLPSSTSNSDNDNDNDDEDEDNEDDEGNNADGGDDREQQQQQQQQRRKKKGKSTDDTGTTTVDASKNKKKSRSTSHEENNNDEKINDSMFEFDDDDSDDDSDEEEKDNNQESPTTARGKSTQRKKKSHQRDENSMKHTQKESSSTVLDMSSGKPASDEAKTDSKETSTTTTLFWKQHQRFLLSELLDAYRCLQHVGIELVHKDQVKEPSTAAAAAVEEGKMDDEQADGIAAAEGAINGKDVSEEDDEEGEEGGGFSFLPNESATTALKRQIAADDKSSTQPITTTTTKTLITRRSNEDVVCDIVNEVRSLSRLQLQINPFCDPPKWIPCGDGRQLRKEGEEEGCEEDCLAVDHPLYVAKICLFRAFTVMDKYCGKGRLALLMGNGNNPYSSLQDPWEGLFDFDGEEPQLDANLKQCIKVGMQHRKGMVEQLMQSLYGEISTTWAVEDRGDLTNKENCLYDPRVEEEEDHSVTGVETSDNAKSYRSMMMTPLVLKGCAIIFTIAERRVLAQLLVSFLLSQKKSLKAFHLVCNYTLSSVPSLTSDDYPKYPPVLSLVVLESMLSVDKDLVDIGGGKDSSHQVGEDHNGFQHGRSYFGCILKTLQGDSTSTHLSSIRRAFALSVHSTALIWRQRLQSSEHRIADSARIEWASYLRLLESQRSWLGEKSVIGVEHGALQFDLLVEEQKDASLRLMEDIQKTESERLNADNEGVMEVRKSFSSSFALALSFLVNGDFRRPWRTFQSTIQEETTGDSLAPPPSPQSIHVLSLACFMAFREKEIRLQNKYRCSIGSLKIVPLGADPGHALGIIHTLLRSAIENKQARAVQILGQTLLHCCSLVSDGEMAYQVLDLLHSYYDGTGSAESGTNVLVESLKNVLQMPTVRVINLQRRCDRMNLMMSQAMQSGVLILKAIATLGNKTSRDEEGEDHENKTCNNHHGGFLFGGFAMDGKLSLDEISELVIENEPIAFHRRRLLEKKFVARQWRPHDLKAFDKNANQDESVLVRLSDSERACALSHIASWKGVMRCLSMQDGTSLSGIPLFRSNLQCLALSSGFARGAALDSRNDNMPPSPVCIVLEDDAILVDRFVDRVNEILEELPRDFHFCSLGYSRPKTAPVVEFGTHIGIPTCIFYLTGYILSLEGAKYLLDSLPVCGPVDSWIGFKMIANWDNRFGASVGVGNKTDIIAETPCSKKDLATILRFRSYAALTPLCYQKVGVGTGWRLRDTDIEYSGSANYSG